MEGNKTSDYKTYGCCLLQLIFVALLFVYGKDLMEAAGKINAEYLVENTGIIHSTNNHDKCSQIAFAKDNNYTISRIRMSKAIDEHYKICKECYSANDQEDYNTKLQDKIAFDQHMKDILAWGRLNKYSKSVNYNALYVYMEENGKLHINGGCFNSKPNDIKLERVKFDNVNHINSTCNMCVDRRLTDFIYKKVNNGIYDISTIDIIDGD